ncbi:MAG: hypothetical protein GQ544_02485 [Candidatus Aminicenantes bacterium]|nr:hypothetical protein [Candidatus Aminicenantes bacterium]
MKGSYANFVHATGAVLTLSGKPGDDAKPYQERLMKQKIWEIQHERKR